MSSSEQFSGSLCRSDSTCCLAEDIWCSWPIYHFVEFEDRSAGCAKTVRQGFVMPTLRKTREAWGSLGRGDAEVVRPKSSDEDGSSLVGCRPKFAPGGRSLTPHERVIGS